MRKLVVAGILAAALGTTACTDRHGHPDALATGLLGLGVGLVAGAAVASANQPHHHHRHAHRPVYSRGHYHTSYAHYGKPSGYGWGYGHPAHRRPRHFW